MSSSTTAAAPRKSAGGRFLASELSVLFRRRRTWALLAALAAIPVLIAVAVRLSSGPSPGRGPAFLDQVSQNGLFVAVVATIVAIPLFLPLTVGVVAGDTVAGEASTGTLRYLLMSPVARGRLLAVKYVGAVVFCLAATFTVAIVGTLMGALLFPVGPVTLLSGTSIGVPEALLRIALVCLYVTLSLLGLCAVGLFMSTLTDVPVGAMAATVVASVVSQVVGQLPQLEWIHPWLLTQYWLGFADLLRDPIVWDSFAANALLQAGYVVVFGALAYGRFSTKDVLA
ncbi:ABC transporter permease [uncultured Arthrobacter sp.]|uniref:ABC transporter permease n=1 Tax=uncultured Arthrobacter sp. TaxID=114050 RepID=UPI00260434A1|nr:ABC transporter permease subunit [uncultured Arthrobacter sp.]